MQRLTATGQFAAALDMLTLAGVFESSTAAFEIFDCRGLPTSPNRWQARTEQVEQIQNRAIDRADGSLIISARSMEYGFFGAVKKAQSALDGLLSAIGDKMFEEGGQASNLLSGFTQALSDMTENEAAIKEHRQCHDHLGAGAGQPHSYAGVRGGSVQD